MSYAEYEIKFASLNRKIKQLKDGMLELIRRNNVLIAKNIKLENRMKRYANLKCLGYKLSINKEK